MNGKTSAALLIVLIAGICAGYFFSNIFPLSEKATAPVLAPAAESSATIFVPALDDNGNGVALPLTVQKRAGNGEILIDINSLVFWFDTQQSIQTARDVAQNLSGAGAGGISLVYMIGANATLVGGPSAGAALAIATIAALDNKTLNKSVMITGTVNPDGTVGQVGGIPEKAKAAKTAGAILFLAPSGQGTETFLKPEEKCAETKGFAYCETRYRRITIDISETAGIQVKEVATIAEAEKYFFG
ncbi:MAG: hypothetical protein KKB25_02165 [Nanoarchaeota archaeon]|nr:hypothetical protein [Nanoarchaeota archaeon]